MAPAETAGVAALAGRPGDFGNSAFAGRVQICGHDSGNLSGRMNLAGQVRAPDWSVLHGHWKSATKKSPALSSESILIRAGTALPVAGR